MKLSVDMWQNCNLSLTIDLQWNGCSIRYVSLVMHVCVFSEVKRIDG